MENFHSLKLLKEKVFFSEILHIHKEPEDLGMRMLRCPRSIRQTAAKQQKNDSDTKREEKK